jgi:trimeric autotransporter adhesin
MLLLLAETLLGSVTSASYAVTASLSQETIGAGLSGGEIQIRNGSDGRNTYSSAFMWNDGNSGLSIGDPNTTGGYGSGDYYLALGVDALAGGYAVAFGSSSYAQGEGTFTHGQEVTATAAYSHAEGYSTVTLGQFSHAEGYNTTATGNNSHAEGANTTSTGQSSHAEGTLTTSQGSYSHAEGQNTIALG